MSDKASNAIKGTKKSSIEQMRKREMEEEETHIIEYKADVGSSSAAYVLTKWVNSLSSLIHRPNQEFLNLRQPARGSGENNDHVFQILDGAIDDVSRNIIPYLKSGMRWAEKEVGTDEPDRMYFRRMELCLMALSDIWRILSEIYSYQDNGEMAKQIENKRPNKTPISVECCEGMVQMANKKLTGNQQGNQESMGGASILAIELDRYSSARTNTDRDLNGWDVRIADTQGSPETRIEKTNHF